MSRSQAPEAVNEVQLLLRAAGYFKATLECGRGCDQEQTLEKLTAWYENNGWLNSLALARDMIRIAKTNNSTTPATVTNTAFQCVAQLLKGKVVIAPKEWKDRQRGKITEKLAPYYATPAE